jgi:hypothetical protein
MLAQEIAALEPRSELLAREAGFQELPAGHHAVRGACYQSQLCFDCPVWGLHIKP